MSKPLEIGNNIGATLRFDDMANLRGFADAQSDRLASLLFVLKECVNHVDEAYFVDALYIASDMAYEVRQAVELLVAPEVAHG